MLKKIVALIFLLACLPVPFTSCIKEYDNPATGVIGEVAPIYFVRGLYKGMDVALSSDNLAGGIKTVGVVISDKQSGNIEKSVFIIQSTEASPNLLGDKTNGIAVKLASNVEVPFAVGDSIIIDLRGSTLTRMQGTLTINNMPLENITKIKSNASLVIQPVTLRNLEYLYPEFESTLISVHADVEQVGGTFSGEKKLNDNTGSNIYLKTLAASSFSSTSIPLNAQFTGIAGYFNSNGNDTATAKKVIMLRKLSDTAYVSGSIYENFPESFESPDFSQKASYNNTATDNNIDLKTGSWKLVQAILGNTVLRDKMNFPGTQCIRMQQNLTTSGYVQMNFDLAAGASKVTVYYGKYSTDPTSQFRLEYSTNGGTTWTAVGNYIADMPERGSKQIAYPLNITGKVRFRINKRGLGTSTPTNPNGRLCIEDIAVYKK